MNKFFSLLKLIYDWISSVGTSVLLMTQQAEKYEGKYFDINELQLTYNTISLV